MRHDTMTPRGSRYEYPNTNSSPMHKIETEDPAPAVAKTRAAGLSTRALLAPPTHPAYRVAPVSPWRCKTQLSCIPRPPLISVLGNRTPRPNAVVSYSPFTRASQREPSRALEGISLPPDPRPSRLRLHAAPRLGLGADWAPRLYPLARCSTHTAPGRWTPLLLAPAEGLR